MFGRGIRPGVRRLFRLPLRTSARLEADSDDELRAFIAERIDYLIARGMPPDEARAEALRRLGAPPDKAAVLLHQSVIIREQRMRFRDAMQTLAGDARYAIRTLRRDAGFTIVATAIIGLGIGATVTVFSVANALLLRPLPFREPDRLVWIANGGTSGLSGQTVQVGNFLDLAAENRSFAELAAYMAFYGIGDTKLSSDGEPARLSAVPVSQGFFPVLGVRPVIGRVFTAEECAWNGPKAVLLSHALWQTRFGADRSVVGRRITLNDEPVTVVGVLPASFDFGSVFAPGTRIDLFVPFPLTRETDQWGNTLSIVGRLKPGVTVASAATEARALGSRITAAHPERNELVPKLTSLREHVSSRAQAALTVLGFAVGVVMLIVCANLSNLLLARASNRQKEMAIRSALGAARARLVRQVLTESVVLSSCGAVVGLLLAIIGTRFVAQLDDVALPLLAGVRLDASALAFTIGLTLMVGLMFGLAPALQIPAHVQETLRATGRGTTEGRRGHWMRSSLVVAEIALACVLLVGSGLLVRSFVKVLDVDLGFRPEQVAALRVDPDRERSASRERFSAYIDDVLGRARAVPGVMSAALTDGLPLGSNRSWGVAPKGVSYARGQWPVAFVRVVSEDYVGTMGMRLIAGRDLSAQDGPSGRPVIMINQSLARKFWPGESAIGKIMKADVEREVIGVVGDVRHLALEEGAGFEMYLPLRQTSDFPQVTLVARSTLATASLAASLRRALEPVAPNLPTNDVRTMTHVVDKAVSPRRFLTVLLGAFAVFALILALLGIYGVVSYTVSRRTQEIGVRMALGATTGSVQARIIRETLTLAAVGTVLGTAASWVLARSLAGFLFGVTATDPLTFGAMLVILATVAVLSGYLPARRASRIDPITALRAG
jgi:predicted permease